MPFLFPIALLFGIGGVAYGVDQNDKRKDEQRKREQEQSAFRAYRQHVESALANKEQELVRLRAFCGESNEQVRILAAEVMELRVAVIDLRRAA